MDGMYCCSYARFAVRAGIVAAIVGVVLFAAATLAGAQTIGTETTFTKDVLPILQRACQQCHRPGSVAPMSLLTYEEVRPWARAVRDKTAQREMPPWFIERNVGVSALQGGPVAVRRRRSPPSAAGSTPAPRAGNPADAPPPIELELARGVAHRDPGVDRRAARAEWTIGAVDADRWLDIWADSRLTDRSLHQGGRDQAVPRRATGSCTTWPRPCSWENEDGEEGGGFLNEYAMGKNGDIFPDGTGRLIRAGTQIRFNMHYSSVGEEISRPHAGGPPVLSRAGHVPERVLISRHVGDSFDTLDIPAGEPTTCAATATTCCPRRPR